MKIQEYVEERYPQLVAEGVDPEKAYTQAVAEFLVKLRVKDAGGTKGA